MDKDLDKDGKQELLADQRKSNINDSVESSVDQSVDNILATEKKKSGGKKLLVKPVSNKKKGGAGNNLSGQTSSGQKRMDPMITPSFITDKDSGFVYFQDQGLSISDSAKIHLKPSHSKYNGLVLMFFLFDWLLSLTFYCGHIFYFINGRFLKQSNHMLHILLGAGFSNIILFYAFSDGARFLRSNFDKILYLISCILQKPILFPILCPSRFRSRIAQKHLDTHTFELKKIEHYGQRPKVITIKVQPTNFLMAVQETNFLYSLTLSGFIAASVTCTMLLEATYHEEDAMINTIMLSIASFYFLYGVIVSIILYGRKTDFLRTLKRQYTNIAEDSLIEKETADDEIEMEDEDSPSKLAEDSVSGLTIDQQNDQ